jgi:hypothetical protein
MTKQYHIIGDIHGHADKLIDLLEYLGYEKRGGVYRQDNAQVVFLGDFIDRGTQEKQVIDIVKPMVESDSAKAVMGNHEFNAICYHSLHPVTLEPLRPHNDKNRKQHSAFLDEYGWGREETPEVIDWFKTLPLHLQIKDDAGKLLFRVVHACWNHDIIGRTPQYLDDDYLLAAATPGTREYDDLEVLLKGPEIPLPKGYGFYDKDGVWRTDIRVRWWCAKPGMSYRKIALLTGVDLSGLPDLPTPKDMPVYRYASQEPPVFFGHYWFTGSPKRLKSNLACLDYSAGKGGDLVAYTWDGSPDIENRNFAYVHSDEKLLQQARRQERKRMSADSLLQADDDSPFQDDPLLDHILRFLAGFNTEFSEPYYGDPKRERELALFGPRQGEGLAAIEAYCQVRDIDFSRPAGPVRMMSLQAATEMAKLLCLYRDQDWITFVPFSMTASREREKARLLDAITDCRVIGHVPAGWKLDIKLPTEFEGCLELLQGSHLSADQPGWHHIYFRNEQDMQDFLSRLKSGNTPVTDNITENE